MARQATPRERKRRARTRKAHRLARSPACATSTLPLRRKRHARTWPGSRPTSEARPMMPPPRPLGKGKGGEGRAMSFFLFIGDGAFVWRRRAFGPAHDRGKGGAGGADPWPVRTEPIYDGRMCRRAAAPRVVERAPGAGGHAPPPPQGALRAQRHLPPRLPSPRTALALGRPGRPPQGGSGATPHVWGWL